MRTKYQIAEASNRDDVELSDGDKKIIARMIKRYGRDNVLAEVLASTGPRDAGRPPRGLLPLYEAIHLAQWYSDRINEFRENGSSNPERDAYREHYRLRNDIFRELDMPEDVPDVEGEQFKVWRKNVGKQLTLGRRALIALETTIEDFLNKQLAAKNAAKQRKQSAAKDASKRRQHPTPPSK